MESVIRCVIVLFTAALLPCSPAYAQDSPKGPVLLGKPSTEWSNIIQTLACAPDGKSVVIGRNNGSTEHWSLETRKLIRTLLDPAKEPEGTVSSQSPMESVLYIPGSPRIAGVGFGFGLRMWDATTGLVVQRAEAGREALAVTSDGSLLATVDGFHGKILLWDPAKGVPVASTVKHKLSVNDLVFSPNGKSLYSCSSDRTIRKWDLASGKELWRVGQETEELSIGPTFPQHLRLSPDGRILAVAFHGCWQVGVQPLDVETGKKFMEIPISHSDGIAFMHGKNVLAVQSNRECLMLYDLDARKPLTRSPGKDATRRFALAFTPDNRSLITPAGDGRIQVWDLSTFEPVRD